MLPTFEPAAAIHDLMYSLCVFTFRPVGEGDLDRIAPRGPLTESLLGAAPSSPPPCRLDDPGMLAVVLSGAPGGPCGSEETLVGTILWRQVRYGPTAASMCPEIGVDIFPAYRGRGAGTWAQRELALLFFRHTNVNRVQACTEPDNLPENRALLRAGFLPEGRLRGALWRDGAFRDLYLYSMLRADCTLPDEPSLFTSTFESPEVLT